MSPKPIRAKDARTITIEIDHRPVTCPEGVSVLRAAELNDVYIPSLCSHKDLSPFGGCRLCMVEIEGMRGYPLACSTLVQEGMKVLSETTALREMRREILELILSEHPSSCLICGEREECLLNSPTVRKSGVSTGCRSCPNDSQCELQTVVEKLGVTEIHYPVYYRGYEPEHDDPFFDRDYNICILCGRCVRICQEVRGTGVLAFLHRGPKTQIGPAFGRNHVEAGCEFCGACVTVCPTGALADKASKWDGVPDGSVVSTCPFCAIGCRLELRHKNGQLSSVAPDMDPEINDGQLCVRGRFCLPETTHHHERARKPVLKRGGYFRDVSWPEAFDEVAAQLKGLKPEDFLMVVSPDLTNESLYAAQKFTRTVMKSNNIDSSARQALPGGPGLWARLFSLPVSIRDIGHADAIIAVGLDSRFSFSVAGVEIRRALREGASLVTIDHRDSNLARYTEHWLRPAPGREGAVLQLLADALLARAGDGAKTGPDPKAGKGPGVSKAAAEAAGVDQAAFDRAVAALAPGKELAVVVGPAAFAVDAQLELGRALLRLAEREHTTFLPLCQGANTRGALELGVFGELLPGLAPAGGKPLALDDLLQGRARPKVLYLVGETPFFDRPDCEYVIAQDIYRPPFEVDAFLPAASFAEAEGTLTNIEGRVQEMVKIENLADGAIAGFTRPDWFILAELAAKLTGESLLPHDCRGILREISETVAGFPLTPDRAPRCLRPAADIPGEAAGAGSGKAATPAGKAGKGAGKAGKGAGKAAGHRLVIEPGGFGHRGVDMSLVVEGLAELGLEEGFRLHPDDLEALGVQAGDPVTLSLDGIRVSAPARVDADAAPGTVTLYRPPALGGLSHRRDLEPLYRLAGNALPVTVSKGGKPGPAAAQNPLPARRADNPEG